MDIGPHIFPTDKYGLVAQAFSGDERVTFLEPALAEWPQLALVHTDHYLTKMRDGSVTPEDVAQLELPWSVEMVEGFRLMVGGTIQAGLIATGLERRSTKSEVRSSKAEGMRRTSDFELRTSDFRAVCHVGGGLHHAFPDHGEGFCPFNDVAVAVRVLQTRGVQRCAIVDLDVHHGNGTAFIFESDPRVFTFSMHQQHNYPLWKPRGSLDIGLPDGAHDATFLRALEEALPRVAAHAPQCIFYLAGADPYEDDQLGGLRLTKEGLRRRDRMVIGAARAAGVPLVVTLAGGYARRLEDTVAIHAATIDEAASASTPSA